MNKDVGYLFIAFLIFLVVLIIALIVHLFKDDLFDIKKVEQFKRRNKLSNKGRRITFLIVVTIILSIFGAERIYNNSDKFNVLAEDASYYDFIDAKIAMNYKQEELNYLYKHLEEDYPFFKVNERQEGKSWFTNKKAYKRLIKNTKNDAEYFVAMERIFGDLNDDNLKLFTGHDFKWNYKNTYMHLAENDDLENIGLYSTLRNPHIMYRYQFAGLEDSILYDEDNLETKIIKENEIAYIKINSMVGFEGLKNDLEKIKDFLNEVKDYKKLIIDIRGNTGGEDAYWKGIVELLANKPLEAEYYSFFKGGHRLDRDPYKVQEARAISELNEDVLNKFPEEVKSDFVFYKVNEIKIEPSNEVNYNGKIYLLVDKEVSRQAENFAAFSKDTGFATLVGTNTGGNSYFEKLPMTYLRNSKFVYTYSRELVINKDGTINKETGTSPDIEVESTIETDINNDKAIQAVINN